ncbi:iron complex transport system substrate-binding protein [Cnuella takakiae]|uniref:Iron complex transport system substrate-binding protein n=1 Tax=Cnuella takakiae TaxID=1302690 RepID=A0A1M5E3E5_9BACT|nr:ABC transporter substrate-binding protein [Cnuella takakiae]OLY93789.1 ABC transporter substrate-binding protein [Cnuella takakiae]SHF73757.1 iron complex transport system substrate-binding protein [Cnuella takakiae]
MKICSFLPAATQMIYDMGLQHLLHGVTFECPQQALAEKPKVVRCVLEDKQYSSAEIDRIFSASKAQGKSLYYVDESLLQQIAPDIIFTQDVCEVCQIDTACTANAVAKLEKQPLLIPLTPQSLEDVFQTAVTIARAAGAEEKAYRYLAGLQARTQDILDTLRKHRMPLKRVSLLEWIEPIYNCGHWIPFQVAQAGGIDMLASPAGDSIVTPWEKIVKYNPEVLVIAPCGFHIGRAAEELHLLAQKPGWQDLEAVKNGQVYLVDFDRFTQPSAGTLVDGIEILAALFHPELFAVPAHLQHKYCNAAEVKVLA